ncbi:hypothetical protein ACSSS7_006614 [Eimeria intestinalis]
MELLSSCSFLDWAANPRGAHDAHASQKNTLFRAHITLSSAAAPAAAGSESTRRRLAAQQQQPEGTPTAAIRTQCKVGTASQEAPIVASQEEEAAAAAQSCSSSSSTSTRRTASVGGSAGEGGAVSPAVRPWVHLPEPLLLQVLDYGGKEIDMTCKRFGGVVCRRRRVLRYCGEESPSCSGDALITAIMSSPSLRLLEVTTGGGVSAAQLERLARARSSALAQRLQVLVMRRCSRITDKGLRTLLLRPSAFWGLLPRLERLALGLTAGARGCCRLTCRSLKALFTPQQQQQQLQQHQQGRQQQQPPQEQEKEKQQEGEKVASIRFLSLARCSEMKDFGVLSGAARTLVCMLLLLLH